MNELMNIKLGKDNTISSMDLVTIINEFRKAECEDYTELQHKDFLKKIRKELETLKFLGFKGEGKISPSSYVNSQNKEQPCYLLNRDGMLLMLNSESTFVRYKTIEYINKLESKLAPSYMIENRIERAKKWIEEEKERQKLKEEKERLQLESKQKDQIIGELKPKADYTDVILKSKSLVTTTQIAKDYGMSGRDFNKKLHELKVQYKQNEQWLLYSKYHDKGYTHSETIAITRSNGIKDTKMNTKWTQKGRLFLYDLLKENGILPMIEMEDM